MTKTVAIFKIIFIGANIALTAWNIRNIIKYKKLSKQKKLLDGKI